MLLTKPTFTWDMTKKTWSKRTLICDLENTTNLFKKYVNKTSKMLFLFGSWLKVIVFIANQFIIVELESKLKCFRSSRFWLAFMKKLTNELNQKKKLHTHNTHSQKSWIKKLFYDVSLPIFKKKTCWKYWWCSMPKFLACKEKLLSQFYY